MQVSLIINTMKMKNRIVLLIAFLATIATVSAQNKKVAILETIDKEDNVPYAIEVMVRSNLTKVISSTPGFEGYDRVDMSQIMGEQNFQRTGMVNEDQIKRLGEISGADFILVSEVVKADEANIFVTAKILNVETARTEASDNVLMGIRAQELQRGCEDLAQKLFQQKKLQETYAKKEDTPVKVVEPVKEEPKKEIVTVIAPVEETPSQVQRPIAPKSQEPVWKKKTFFGLNAGVGTSELAGNYFYGSGIGITLGLDLAFPLGKRANVGVFATAGYENAYGSGVFEIGPLLMFNFNRNNSLYLGGGFAGAFEGSGYDFRIGYRIKHFYFFGEYTSATHTYTKYNYNPFYDYYDDYYDSPYFEHETTDVGRMLLFNIGFFF